MINILLTGVGGQGTVLASSILQKIYLDQGRYLKSTETIGMAQMGGGVSSHIRTGKEVHSPFVPKGGADIIFAFEPAEGARNLAFVGKDTVVIVNQDPIKPVTDTLSKTDYDPEVSLRALEENAKTYRCDFSELFQELGTNKALNVAMIGFAIGLDILEISYEEMEGILKANMPEKILAMNLRALEYGMEKGKTYE